MEDSQCRKLKESLKSEFTRKRSRLKELKTEIDTLTSSFDTITLTEQQQSITGDFSLCTLNELMSLRHKLDKLSSKLKAIHTEGSHEHIHLTTVHEELIALHKRRDVNTLNTSAEFQKLVKLVIDLQSDNEWNCQLKEEIENQINRAYRKIAKQQAVLCRKCSEVCDPVDKENVEGVLDSIITQHINPEKLAKYHLSQAEQMETTHATLAGIGKECQDDVFDENMAQASDQIDEFEVKSQIVGCNFKFTPNVSESTSEFSLNNIPFADSPHRSPTRSHFLKSPPKYLSQVSPTRHQCFRKSPRKSPYSRNSPKRQAFKECQNVLQCKKLLFEEK